MQKPQHPSTTTFGEPLVPEIPVVLGVSSPPASPQPGIVTEEPFPNIQDPVQILK